MIEEPEPFGQCEPLARKALRYGSKGLLSAGTGVISLAASAALVPLANVASDWAVPLVFAGIPLVWTAWGGLMAFAVWKKELTEWLRKR